MFGKCWRATRVDQAVVMESVGMSDERSEFAKAVQQGLAKKSGKSLPCKFIYDAQGSKIFEEISTISDYYPTQAELSIIADRSGEIAALCGPRVSVVELGSGSSTKTRAILDALVKSGADLAYFPIDISAAALQTATAALKKDYPQLKLRPIEDEYERALPKVDGQDYDTNLVLWLGTSIGNLEPDEAEALLRLIHRTFASKGVIIVGADLKKDRGVLERAYNDPGGVTARFNLNLLQRINREFGGHFDLSAFEHLAFYNEDAGRIEMHILSRRAQTVPIDMLGISVDFAQGETIHTENSYKFSKDDIGKLADRSGFRLDRHWRDGRGLYSVNVLGANGPRHR
jgi:dimethylhistidine N-methyltransferase